MPEGDFSKLLLENKFKVITLRGVSQFDNCEYSFYRGFRWLILLRELFYFFPTIFKLIKCKKKWGEFDIVHINDITMSIISLMIKKLDYQKTLYYTLGQYKEEEIIFKNKL